MFLNIEGTLAKL